MSKGDETRRRVVAEAAALFNQHGFEGSSMSDLMDRTGLEKGGLYRHFSGKEEIAAEAFDYAWQAASEARMADLDQVPNSVDRLKRFVANFVERPPAVPGGCPLLNTAIDADDGNRLLRKKARGALRQWIGRLTKIVAQGIEAKEIRRDVDAKKLAMLMISSLEGALMIGRLERDRESLATIQSFLNNYLEKEVRVRTR